MRFFKGLLICSFVALLAACVPDQKMNSTGEGDLPYTFSQFSDIPLPENASMNLDKTAIFGRENDWVGKIVFTAPYSVGGVFDFYMSEMPKFGWSEITSVRGQNSVLTFYRGKRVALIQLQPSNFQGTVVLFTMSPAPAINNKKVAEDLMPKPVQKQEVVAMPMVETKPVQQFQEAPRQIANIDDIASKERYPNVDVMPLTNSSVFISPDAQKALNGSLNLGDASNVNYKSNSKGVGTPPRAI